MKKKVLILGSGGREHALAWAFAMDDNVSEVYCAPGNGGTAEIAENIKVNLVNLRYDWLRGKILTLQLLGQKIPWLVAL